MTPQYSHLLPPSWKSQVSAWLDEDTLSFDYGGFVVGEAAREAFLLDKGSRRTVLPGGHATRRQDIPPPRLHVGIYTFPVYDRYTVADVIIPVYSVERHVAEGDEFEPIKHIATVHEKARYLLLGERVTLNLLARCSGIATACV
jgi:nicotinate-nucleotide pyrophosphorylase (carboxylating)